MISVINGITDGAIRLRPSSPPTSNNLLVSAYESLSTGYVRLSPTGLGGTYYLYNKDYHSLAVFKVADEELGAVNNPKGILECVPLITPGVGFLREIAAWLLDKDGRAGVPETHFFSVESTHPSFKYSDDTIKYGSLQKFIPNIGNAESISSSYFLTSDVHNIGILDLRIYNLDRNLENLLVTVQKTEDDKKVYRLVPIDHGSSLPPSLGDTFFEWLYWSQAKEPFSQDELNYISSIDIQKDAIILYNLGFPNDCIRTMKISTTWLKYGAEEGLNLFEIGYFACRPNQSKPSFLERIVVKAEERSGGEVTFFVVLGELLKEAARKIKQSSISIEDLDQL